MFNTGRLYDIFFSSLVYIYSSQFIKVSWLKYFVLCVGLMTNLYNLHNFLLINVRLIDEPINVLRPFVDVNNGKTQLHRLYNILLMYPLLYYSTKFMPSNLSSLMRVMIVCGLIYNSLNYLKIKTKKIVCHYVSL